MYAIATTEPGNVEALRLAVIAAEALMIGLPILVVAFATLLRGDSTLAFNLSEPGAPAAPPRRSS